MKNEMLDPVCGMTVNPETAAAKAEFQGKTFYFCSPGCRVAFLREPEKYLHSQHNHGHSHHHH